VVDELVLFESENDVAGFSAGFGMFVLPETAADKPGLALLPFVAGEFDEELSLTAQLTLRLQSTLDITGGAGILVRPGRDVIFPRNTRIEIETTPLRAPVLKPTDE